MLGVTTRLVREFEVSDLGDESGGLVLSGEFEGLDVEARSSVAWFRIGRLIGSASVNSAGDSDHGEDAERLARALEERVRGVLVAEIEATPVPLPRVSSPPGGEVAALLEAMVLTPDDLPEGARIELDEWSQDGNEVALERSFATQGLLQLGSSQLMFLSNEVTQYETPLDANLFVGFFTNPEALDGLMATTFESMSGGQRSRSNRRSCHSSSVTRAGSVSGPRQSRSVG